MFHFNIGNFLIILLLLKISNTRTVVSIAGRVYVTTIANSI